MANIQTASFSAISIKAFHPILRFSFSLTLLHSIQTSVRYSSTAIRLRSSETLSSASPITNHQPSRIYPAYNKLSQTLLSLSNKDVFIHIRLLDASSWSWPQVARRPTRRWPWWIQLSQTPNKSLQHHPDKPSATNGSFQVGIPSLRQSRQVKLDMLRK